MERIALPEKIWRLGGARPLNHPQRRLGALRQIAGGMAGACSAR